MKQTNNKQIKQQPQITEDKRVTEENEVREPPFIIFYNSFIYQQSLEASFKQRKTLPQPER